MSADPDKTPPAGEEIHLPGQSLQPVLLAVGIAIALVGVTTSIIMVIAGGILAVVMIVRWIRDTRREIAELPADHFSH